MGFFVATLSPNNSNASRNRLVPGSACVSSGSPPPFLRILGSFILGSRWLRGTRPQSPFSWKALACSGGLYGGFRSECLSTDGGGKMRSRSSGPARGAGASSTRETQSGCVVPSSLLIASSMRSQRSSFGCSIGSSCRAASAMVSRSRSKARQVSQLWRWGCAETSTPEPTRSASCA